MSSPRNGEGGALSPGTRLGPYEIAEKIGVGGMGEVYRATDIKLKRDVAIKVLPEAFTESKERLDRFSREAQLLAQLHHPHIASIFGLEESAGVQALVMELVEGPTLGERLARGALSLDDCLAIARQIAEALEVAHEKGIVHRDLKPANVKLTPDGDVKVLDFGLAKALDPATTSSDSPSVSLSPTLTMGATVQGVILGTAAYMAPEQAAGKGVDRRADIWAFGVVLYEMLTGGRLFDGESVSHVLAGVLKDEPDFSALPAATPQRIVNLVRRCLQKKPRQRLQAIGDARVVIEEVIADPETDRRSGTATDATSPARSARLPWAVAGAAVLAAVAFAFLGLRASTAPGNANVLQASLFAPPGTALGETFALSPDGRHLAFQAFDQETGTAALWLRDLDVRDARRLEGTERGEMPFWSPDGQHLGFFAEGRLKRVDPMGGRPQALADAPTPRGGTWNESGWIVFSPTFRDGLWRVPAGGGAPAEPLTTLDASRGEKSHRFPVFLPGGKRLLFLAQTAEGGAREDTSRIDAFDPASRARTPLVAANSSPLLSPGGELLFWREGALSALAFDLDHLTVSGDVRPIATGVAYSVNEQALASISGEGTLVYKSGEIGSLSTVIRVDRRGVGLELIQDRQALGERLALSHDGTRLLVESVPPGAASDLWIHDLERGSESRLTLTPSADHDGVWSPDDRWVYYANNAQSDGIIYRRRADGAGEPELLGDAPGGLWPEAISRDGRWLVAGLVTAEGYFDLERFDLATGKTAPLIATPFLERFAALSADDRLLAYTSEEPGRPEILVSSLDSRGGRWQISTDGGSRPRWSADGRELFYLAPPDRVMVVDVAPGEVPRFSVPRLLFQAPLQDFDVAPDGQSFVAARTTNGGSSTAFQLVTNWPRLLVSRRAAP